MFKRLLSVILIVILVITSVPLGGLVGIKFDGIDLSLENIFSIKAKAQTEVFVEGIYEYRVEDDTAIIVDTISEVPAELILPETLGSYVVSGIGENAFEDSKEIIKIEIPCNIKYIGNYAFAGCTNLNSVDLGDVVNLGYKIFEGCTKLDSIEIPNTVDEDADFDWTDGAGVLYGSGITKVKFEDGLKIIPRYICAECENITEVTISDSVTKISYNAFEGCVNLQEIKLPDVLEVIDESAFYGCSKISEVKLKSVKTVENYAFAGCANLSSVDLGDVVNLGYKIFEGCTKLDSIEIPNTVDEDADFDWTDGAGVLYGSGITKVKFEDGLKIIPRYICAECENITEVTISDSVTKISYNAFEECANLKEIILPDSLECIENRAFYKCLSLKEVKLPSDVKVIEDHVFDGCEQLTVKTVKEDSITAIKLIDKEIPFEAELLGIKDSNDRNLDRNYSNFELSQQLSSSSNGVMLTLKYDFKEEIKKGVSNCNIDIKMPSDVICDINSIKVNGKAWADCQDGSFISINNLPVSVTITFKIYLEDTSYFASYAKINYRLNKKNASETVGLINSADEILTISAPKETDSKGITVSGIAPADKLVDIYLDGTYIKTISSSKTGRYICDIDLDKATNNKKYIIEAKINDGKKLAKTEVLFTDKAVEIISAKMKYRGTEYDLIGLQGKQPVVTWVNGAAYNFEIKVDKSNEVKHIIIVNRNSKGSKILSCKYDSNKDLYVAEGFNNDTIGTISIICITTNNYKSIISEVNFIGAFEEKFAEDISNKYTTIVKENSMKDNPVAGKFEIEMIDNESNNEVFNFTIDSINTSGVTIESLENDSNYECCILEDGSKNYISTPKKEKNKYFTRIYHVDSDNELSYAHSFEALGDVSSIINFGFDLLGVDGKFIGSVEDLSEELAEKMFEGFTSREFNSIFSSLIDNSILGYPESTFILDGIGGVYGNFAMKLAKIVFAEEDVEWEEIGCCIVSGIFFVAAVVFPEFAVPLSIMLTLCDLLIELDKYESISDMFKMLIDPSGYVYEVNPGERLAGVTTTAYWIPYDENNSDFWSEDYPDDSKAILWDAEEYDQVNPLVTDENGSYAWDTPVGWWRVKYEKEGYETAWSEWLPVPPPQLDVNIAMTTTEAPEVNGFIIEGNTVTVEFSQYVNVATINTSNCIVKIDNNIANGSWTAVGADTYAKDKNMQIAKKFIFTATEDFGNNYSISINNVVNYAGITMKESYNNSTVPAVHEHNYIVTTVPSSCTVNGSSVYNCACGYTYTEVILAKGHQFNEGDSRCINCDYSKSDVCSCNCHKSGIAKIIFKIILFFQKIFKMNRICYCGIYHY